MTIIEMPSAAERAARKDQLAQAARLRVNAAKLRKMANEMDVKALLIERRQ